MLESLRKIFLKNRFQSTLFIILAFLGLTTRFVFLDKVPPGVSHDELDLILSAETFLSRGADASGVSFPRFLIATRLESASTGLPSLLLSIILGPFHFSMVSVRVFYSLLNVATGVFFAKLFYRLTKNAKIGALAFLVFLLNPWSFFYTKMALAAPFALFFLVAGLYLFFTREGWKASWAFIFFLLSMFSYLGALFVVPLIVVLLVVFCIGKVSSRQIKINLLLLLVLLSSLFAFLFISKAVPESILNRRSDELSFMSLRGHSGEVNKRRRQTIGYSGKKLILNKGAVFLETTIEKYSGAFSTNLLFLSGDTRAAYNFGNHGLFYYLDALFIILGLVGIYIYGKKAVLVFMLLFLVGPAGSAISTVERSYVFRSFPLLLGYVGLISLGLYFLLNKLSGRVKQAVALIVFIAYFLSFARFLAFFFFEYSVVEAENHYLSERVLVKYLATEKESIYVAVENPSQVYRQYVFFESKTDLLKEVGYQGQKFEIDNIVITNKCPTKNNTHPVLVTESSLDCEGNGIKVLIQNQKDAGTVYEIYGGSLCKNVELDVWRRNHRMSDYSIEQMGNKEFCNRWIATPLNQ